MEGPPTKPVRQGAGAMALVQAPHALSYATEAEVAVTESGLPNLVDRVPADFLLSQGHLAVLAVV